MDDVYLAWWPHTDRQTLLTSSGCTHYPSPAK